MINIGLVGAGGMGTVHYTSFQYVKDARVAAVVGTAPGDASKAEEWGLPLYETIPAMLAGEAIDIVDVCTPTFLHRAHVCAALQGGKSVICEKPLALSAADAKEMYALAEEVGAQLYVAHVLQFYPETEVLRRLVQSGEYGKALDASFTRLSACPRWAAGGWLFDKAKSGLVPFDLHIHDLDLIVSLFGMPQTHSYTSCGGADKAYKELYRFSYGYPGLTVSAEAGWLNADIPFTARWRVYFENAMVASEGGCVTAWQFDKPPRVFDTEEKLKIPTGINVPPTGTYLAELGHFLDCFARGVPSDIVPQSQVLAVLELLEQVAG